MTAGATVTEPDADGFRVELANFAGPFDLLLSLISSHRLDVTEVALHQVTDEFIAYTKQLVASKSEFPLEQTTSFLVVAATLLDLKAARLLPRGDVENEDDLDILEARDLLFARLLQYRAFKQVAELFAELEAAALQRYARSVSLEDRFSELLPEVMIGVSAEEFAEIAASAFRPRPAPEVRLGHLHMPVVSIPEQAEAIGALLRSRGAGVWLTFHDILESHDAPIMIVARFMALLELFRSQSIDFDQPDPLGELRICWAASAA